MLSAVQALPAEGTVTQALGIMAARINLTTPHTIIQLIMRSGLMKCEMTILELFKKQFGWLSSRKLQLSQVRIVLFPWKDPTNENEPRGLLTRGKLMKASLYEWICFSASDSVRAHCMLDEADIILFGKDAYILLHKDGHGCIHTSEISEVPTGTKKPLYYASTYLLVD